MVTVSDRADLIKAVTEEIKKAEKIRGDRFDTASVSVGVRNKQFHRTAVKYKGMVIAYNKVLELLNRKGGKG
jgi:hypothetical protein